MSEESSNLNTCRSFLMQVKAGDTEAWTRFVDLYSPLVYHWCHVAGLPSYDIPDIFQDVFSSVARAIGDFHHRPTTGSFRSWLRTITKNKIIDYYRKKSKIVGPEGGTDAQKKLLQVPLHYEMNGEDESNQSAQRWLMLEKELTFEVLFMNIIPKVQKHFQAQTWDAFWAVVVDGKSPAEVAVELGLKPSTVRVAKSRVLCRLRKELGETD